MPLMLEIFLFYFIYQPFNGCLKSVNIHFNNTTFRAILVTKSS